MNLKEAIKAIRVNILAEDSLIAMKSIERSLAELHMLAQVNVMCLDGHKWERDLRRTDERLLETIQNI